MTLKGKLILCIFIMAIFAAIVFAVHPPAVLLPKISHTWMKHLIHYDWKVGEKDRTNVLGKLSFKENKWVMNIYGSGAMIDLKDENGEEFGWRRSLMNTTVGWLVGIENVNIEASVETVGAYAFSFCPELKKVSLPSSICKIGEGAFMGCSNLKSVHFGGTVAKWNEIILEDNWDKDSGIAEVICLDDHILLSAQ